MSTVAPIATRPPRLPGVPLPPQGVLQALQAGGFSQLRAFAGDVLYTEGMRASHLYVIKDGEVDLYLMRDEKRVVVETLKAGQCFGLSPHTPEAPRATCAAARSYCELVLVDVGTLAASVARADEVVQGLLATLSQRLTAAHAVIAARVNYQPELLAYAQMLQLMGLADVGKPATPVRGAAPANPLARVSVEDVQRTARLMFGHADRHIRSLVDSFVRLHLARLEDESGGARQLVFAPRDFVAQVRRIVDAAPDPDADKLSYEYIGVDEFAALVEVDRSQILRKLAAGEFADDLFTFRRAELLRLLDSKGKRFFAERKLKPASEFKSVEDLEFADPKAVFGALAKLDAFDVARVMHGLPEGPARSRLLGALSQRRRKEVEEELQGLGEVDAVVAQQLSEALVADVRQAMLQKAG